MSKYHATNTRRARLVRSLPLNEWPEADRLGWEAACRPGQRLVRGGAASHLAPITRADLARRYGYYLDFLQRAGRLDLTAEAGALLPPDNIAAFVAELQGRVSSVTVSRTIYKVRRAVECIAPNRNFAWLAEIGNDLVLLERPKDRFDRIVLTERLVEAGLALFQEADADANGRPVARALGARNGLMVALLALCPIRLKNFAALEIGRTFLKIESVCWIVVKDTKSRRPDHRPVPSLLNGFIERYLEVYRPTLLHHSTPALWISRLGGPLSYDSVERAIIEATRMSLGVPVSPHLFRTSDATSAALYAPHSPHLASALLQHSHSRTTEEHYNRASSLSVARDFATLIADLRAR